jgi:hypothetical protein
MKKNRSRKSRGTVPSAVIDSTSLCSLAGRVVILARQSPGIDSEESILPAKWELIPGLLQKGLQIRDLETKVADGAEGRRWSCGCPTPDSFLEKKASG